MTVRAKVNGRCEICGSDKTVRAKVNGRCVICDTDKGIERNHVGGQNHVAWFTMPFCRKHHAEFHAFLRAAGIELEYTSDPQERILRGFQATIACQWILMKKLQEVNSRSETGTHLAGS